jgi:PKD repeat protein
LQLQIVRPPDIPPVANFTVTPTNPVAGQNVAFDGSASFDPDGTVVFWSWSFGDNVFSGGTFTNHNYNRPGNYTVTLTVTDNAGLSSTRSTTVNVRPQPAHDVAMVEVDVRPTTAVATQTVFINIQLLNNGLNNETVSLTAYANGRPVQTLRGLFLPACVPSPFNFCGFRDFFTIAWDTSGVTPGNYTISVTVFLAPGEVDPTPADNSMNGGTVTILPAPVITLSPSTGPDGTKVQVQGTGFLILEQFGYIPVNFVYVNFDNMSTGFTIAHNGTFTFTFDVPLSQAGTHGVFAFDPFSGPHASATFTVLPTFNNNLALRIDMGTIYFPEDTATAYILTTVNGAPTGQSIQLQVTLFKPDGTNTTLTAIRVGTGLYKATYTIPSTGPLGTYLVLAKAHQPGPMDASSLVSFEVKLTWLGSNSGKITVGATTLAGLVGLVGLAWKKGYFRKKDNESSTSPF